MCLFAIITLRLPGLCDYRNQLLNVAPDAAKTGEPANWHRPADKCGSKVCDNIFLIQHRNTLFRRSGRVETSVFETLNLKS